MNPQVPHRQTISSVAVVGPFPFPFASMPRFFSSANSSTWDRSESRRMLILWCWGILLWGIGGVRGSMELSVGEEEVPARMCDDG